MTKRFRFRLGVLAFVLVCAVVPILASFVSWDSPGSSFSDLVYDISPDVVPLSLVQQGSNYMAWGDNLALQYLNGEYSLLVGRPLTDSAFHVDYTVPLASGGSSAWTTSDVSTALSRMSTIGSYLMGSGSISYSIFSFDGNSTVYTDGSLGVILSRIATNFSDTGYHIFTKLMGSSGNVPFNLFSASGAVGSYTSTSLGSLLGTFAYQSTQNQSSIYKSLIGSGSVSSSLFNAGGLSTTSSYSNLASLLSDFALYSTRNQQALYRLFLGSSGSTSFNLYSSDGSVDSYSASDFGSLFGTFASQSTQNQSSIFKSLIGSGSVSSSLFNAGGLSSSGTYSDLASLLSDFASFSTRNQQTLYKLYLGSSGSTSFNLFSPDGSVGTYSAFDLGTLIGASAYQSTLNQSSIYQRLMGSKGSVSASFLYAGQSAAQTLTFSDLGSLFAHYIFTSQSNSVLNPNTSFLGSNGLVSSSSNFYTVPFLLSSGFNGLATILRGQSGSVYSAQILSFDDDLNMSVKDVQYTNILQALAHMSTSLQNPLSQLQAVLADDDDLALKQATQAEVAQVTSDFTSGGVGAPSVTDISDLANVSGQLSSMFNSGTSAADFFTAANSSDVYSFFSQAVADDLNSVNSISVLSVDDSDPFDGLILNDDGFYVLADTSLFDYRSLIGGE